MAHICSRALVRATRQQALQLEDDAGQLEAQAWQTALKTKAEDPWPPRERAQELATAASGQSHTI